MGVVWCGAHLLHAHVQRLVAYVAERAQAAVERRVSAQLALQLPRHHQLVPRRQRRCARHEHTRQQRKPSSTYWHLLQEIIDAHNSPDAPFLKNTFNLSWSDFVSLSLELILSPRWRWPPYLSTLELTATRGDYL